MGIYILSDGSVRVVEEDELERAVAKGIISQKLATLVRDDSMKILTNLKKLQPKVIKAHYRKKYK